jgi:hypothetical protein
MARNKKKPDDAPENAVLANGVAVAEPPETPQPEPQQGARDAPPAHEASKPPANRLAASFAAYSDRTTRIEVAVWAKKVVVSEQEEYTQYALTLSRAWQKDGAWQGNAAFRVHDVPVLLYLVQQAYHWCVAQRTTVKIGDEPLPF